MCDEPEVCARGGALERLAIGAQSGEAVGPNGGLDVSGLRCGEREVLCHEPLRGGLLRCSGERDEKADDGGGAHDLFLAC